MTQLEVQLEDRPDELELAFRRFMIKKGQARATRYESTRVFRRLRRLGFPWAAFWAAGPDLAEDLAVDWLDRYEDERRRSGNPLKDGGWDQLVKCINKASKAARNHMERIEQRSPKWRVRRISKTGAECKHALDSYRHVERAFMERDRAVAAWALASGVRRTEESLANLDDLLPDSCSIMVEDSGKNGVKSPVPVAPELWAYIQAWLDVRPTPEDEPMALFTTLRRPIKRLKPAGVYKVLNAVGKKAGLDLNNTVCRHTRNRRLKRANWPTWARQMTLRHAGKEAIIFYDENSPEDVLEVRDEMGDPGLFEDVDDRVPCPTCQRPIGAQELARLAVEGRKTASRGGSKR